MTRKQETTLAVTVGVGLIVLTFAASWAAAADPNTTSTGDLRAATAGTGPTIPAPAATRRGEAVLLGTYPEFDYWNLDTGAVRDSAGLLHFSVRLWEYNHSTPNYDRYVINPAGQVVQTWLDWYGLGGVPAFTDGNGHNLFVRPSSTSQYFGVTDQAENIHVFNTSAQPTGWEVHYSKLNPQGNTVIPWTVVTTGADCWNWYVQPMVNHANQIIVTWIRDTLDICAIVSDDGGASWSDIRVLFPNAGVDQAATVKTLVAADDALHFVWRTLNWTTYVERLWYAKTRADWSVAVDETMFYEGTGAWYPYASLDDQGSVHVTFAPTYDVATDIYYTRLHGDLDLNGAPATDALLTALPERVVHRDPDYAHYPMNLVDAYGTVHVVYEGGDYGRLTDKNLYYFAICSLDGDVNCDEFVDLNDFCIFMQMLVGPGAPAPAGVDPTDFANADLDHDGDVDLADVAAFQNAFGSGEPH
ncbi:MAG TPA: dockerin type I repeat-containing protein [Phycisphaerae bacterium]|nr:dockerin type I repeat-containing protein [Phycisphaerae bacterium]HNU43734.1 dockerin type I repeat-containing protein [Phycisphaerae bacterium]